MKKYTCILFILYSLNNIFLLAQEDIPVNLQLKTEHPAQTYNYQATQTINFTPGFSFKATANNYLKAWISPLNIQPNPYPDNIEGGSNSGIVGKIKDEFTVGPSGQASYEIPIMIPSGTGGMMPQLSIVYNSSTKDGWLGCGFDLSGLSMINRAPQNLHTDGKITSVNFSQDDRFMLDGNRLIRISPIAQTVDIEYRTENNIFSKIITSGSVANPEEFTVYTKSGLIYTYGSNNSTLRSSSTDTNSNLFWFLVRVTDTKGNYYKISYHKDEANGEYYPDRIDYTGNDKTTPVLTPYASVRFSYNKTSPIQSYIYGYKVQKSKVINKIEIYHVEKKIKSYDFTYQSNLNTQLLTSVTEVASDGKKLNPTKFDWNRSNGVGFTDKYSHSHSILFAEAKTYIGDFDGDGINDYLIIRNIDGQHTCYMFSATDIGSPIGSQFKFQNIKEIKNSFVGDFNGDGLSDIIIVYDTGKNKLSCDLFIANYNKTGQVGFSFSKNLFSSTEYTAYRDIAGYVGDFNGDGVFDFAYYALTETLKRGSNFKRFNVLISSINSQNQVQPLSINRSGPFTKIDDDFGNVEIVDFNGDGLSDILYITDKGSDLYVNKYVKTSDQTLEFETVKHFNYPIFFKGTKSPKYILGDFNGDGKTDFITSIPDKKGWRAFFSDGMKFIMSNPLFSNAYTAYSSDNSLHVCDINGDGFDDFVALSKDASGTNSINTRYYINQGDGINFKEYTGFQHAGSESTGMSFFFADFDGDGKSDILEISTETHIQKLRIASNQLNNLLSSITDGLGNKTEISYKPLTDNSVYEKGTTNTYPVSSITPSWYVVDRVSQNNGIGGKFEKTYKYKNLLLHKRGRGVLGFEYFTENDLTNKIQTTSQFEFEPTEFITALKSTEVHSSGKLVSKSTYTNKLKSYQDKVFTYNTIAATEKQYEVNTGKEYSSINTRTVYDDYGNVTRSVIKYNSTDSVININKYEKDNISKWYLGRLSESSVTKVSAKGTVKRLSRFDYDSASGLLNKEEVEPDNAELGYTKTYKHDKFGNIEESTTTPKNTSFKARTKKSKYDSQGRFEIESTNDLGFTTKRDVNYDLGLVNSETDPNGLKTEYIYDSFGQIQFTKTPLGNTQTLILWSADHTEAPSNSVYFTYAEVSGAPPVLEFFDGLGRCLRRKVIGFDGKAIYTDIVYNAKGQVEKTSEPYFAGGTVYWNKSEYDIIGRVTKQIYPDDSFHTYTYDGLKTVTTSPLGLKDTKISDVQGRIIESIDNKSGSVKYTYDAAGNCETVVGPRTTIKASFDLVGNRTKLIDPDLGTIEYKYNAYGELVWQKNAEGHIKTVEYDGGGRIKEVVESEGTTKYIYDTLKKGLLTSVTSPDYSQSYKYDAYCRITDITEVIENKTYTTKTAYDALNRVDKITYPTGFTIKHNYNSYGYLSEVRNSQSGQLYWVAQTMNARGQLEKFKLGNNLTTTTTHNPQKGYITSIKTPGIQDWSYTFNTDGNLTSRKDNSRNLTEKFEYDGLNRLSKTYHNNVIKEEVSYDAAGNITSKTGVGTKFEYFDNTNKLKSVSGGSYTPPDWAITYTSFNKISQVVQGNNSLILMYGADKQRKKAIYTKDGKSDTRYYIGALYEENILSTGEVKKTHHIFANGGAIAIFEQSSLKGETLLYLHKDHLGSIQAYSDKNGKLVQELSYDAWGRRRSADEWKYYLNIPDAKALHDRGFTGHEHLDMFEMINMNGRMYDPMLGRFLSPDPFVQAPDFTQGLNRYIYCLNNPLSLVDPSGYSWFSKNWKSLVASVVGITVAALVPGGQAIGAVILKGALGGMASGLAGALLNGANIGQIAHSAVTGGFWGAASAAASFGVGEFAGKDLMKKLLGHSMSQGALSAAQGGNFKHGFISGLVSAGGGYGLSKAGNLSKFTLVSANAIIGGTASELGGGKFANGAITGAYVVLFNCLMHPDDGDGKVIKTLEVITTENGTYIVSYNELGIAQYHIIGEPGLDPIYVELEMLGALGPKKVIEAIRALKTMLNGLIQIEEIEVLGFKEHKNGKNWQKHTDPRAGGDPESGRYGQTRNENKGNKNKKHIPPKNPNKRK